MTNSIIHIVFCKITYLVLDLVLAAKEKWPTGTCSSPLYTELAISRGFDCAAQSVIIYSDHCLVC